MANLRKESLEIAREVLIDSLDLSAMSGDDMAILKHTLLTLLEDQEMFMICHAGIYASAGMVRTLRKGDDTNV